MKATANSHRRAAKYSGMARPIERQNAMIMRFVPNLYEEVRAGFVRQCTTLNAWCHTNLVTRQYAEKCLRFERNGPAANSLRKRILRAAKVAARTDAA